MRRRSATDEAGFTLVELMIVLVILGVMSAAVVIAMPDSGGSVRDEAEQFAARAKAARDRAIIEARPVALRVGPDGYHFQQRVRRAWQPVVRPPLESRHWQGGVSAGGETMVVFDPTGLAEPADIVLVRDDTRLTVAIGVDGAVDVRG